MLVVNNSKNPVHDAKSLAKYSNVGEEAGSCCNHGKNPGGATGSSWGSSPHAYWHQRITMMCLRRGAGKKPAATLHYILPVAIGVCFGKAAIIRPRAPPRDDKLQSIECDTRHSAKFLDNDASGDGRRFAANRMKIDTTFIHTQAGLLTNT